MKKTLLFASLLSINFAVNAQTITESNIASVGDSIIMAIDNSPSISIGTNTTGNTWNFSSLLNNSTDTTVFISPATAPGGSNFPASNLSFLQDVNNPAVTGKANTFLTKSSTSLQLDGISDGTIYGKHQDPETVITFPSSFGTSFTDAALIIATVTGAQVGQPVADSVKIKSITNITSTFNASGTLTTPYGIFPAIRQYTIRETIDTIWAKGLLTGGNYIVGSTSKDTTYSHQYYSDNANTKFPIVTYNVTKAGVLTGDASWMLAYSSGNTTGANELEVKSISIYPNPVQNTLTINNQDVINSISIMDVTGKVVYKTEKQNIKTLNVDFLNKGIYILSIETDSYFGTTKFIKQ